MLVMAKLLLAPVVRRKLPRLTGLEGSEGCASRKPVALRLMVCWLLAMVLNEGSISVPLVVYCSVTLPVLLPAVPPEVLMLTALALVEPGATKPLPRALVALKWPLVTTLEMPSCSEPAPMVVLLTASTPVASGGVATWNWPRSMGPAGVAEPCANFVVRPEMPNVWVATLPKLLTTATLWPASAPPVLPAVNVMSRLPLLAPAAMAPKVAAVTPLPLRRVSVMLPRPGVPVWMAPRMLAPVPLLAIWKLRVALVPPRTLPKSSVKVLAPATTTLPVSVCEALLPRIWPVPLTPARALKLLPLPKPVLV